MADKKDKKDDKKAPAGNPAEEMFIIGFILFVGIMLLMKGLSYLTPTGSITGTSTPVFSNAYIETLTGGPNGWYANLLYFFSTTVSVYVKVATVFSIVTFLAILYVAWLTYRLSVEDKKKDGEAVVAKEIPSEHSQKWQRVLAHANSLNAAEWRLSILEADVMLDDLLQKLGYHGESLGEKLKNVEKADFKTIDSAWEAHKIRNMIAHEGTDFPIAQHEVKRIIGLYGQVFQEFSFV